MNKKYLLFVLILVTQACHPPFTITRETEVEENKKENLATHRCASLIDSILADTSLRHSFAGVAIASTRTGEILYEYNAHRLFRPASNIKLFTTAAALSILGPDYELKTEVYFAQETESKAVPSIVLKGYGDPLLTEIHLDSLVRLIVSTGIREIKDIIGDVSFFDDVSWGRGWMWDDEPKPGAAHISAIGLNRNLVEIKVSPAIQTNKAPIISLDPPTKALKVINTAITTTDTTVPLLTITRDWRNRDNTLLISGRIAPNQSPQTGRVNLWRPEEFVLQFLREKLESAGITMQGIIRFDTLPGNGLIGSISHRLDSVATIINKDSYNLGSENLLKVLAAQRFGSPGTAEGGISIVKRYLDGIGIDTTQIMLADGSGVSRYNLASPAAVVRLLSVVKNDPKLSWTFQRSLPIGGIDGTLRNRMTASIVRGLVRAKTGTHADGSTLSGFLTTASGDELIFSIMINHFTGALRDYHRIQERVLEVLFDCK